MTSVSDGAQPAELAAPHSAAAPSPFPPIARIIIAEPLKEAS
jgi:hypothetical protein